MRKVCFKCIDCRIVQHSPSADSNANSKYSTIAGNFESFLRWRVVTIINLLFETINIAVSSSVYGCKLFVFRSKSIGVFAIAIFFSDVKGQHQRCEENDTLCLFFSLARKQIFAETFCRICLANRLD